MHRKLTVAIIAGVTLAGAACSSSNNGGTAAEAAYCTKLSQLPHSDGGPIDGIFTQYGDHPTLAQWATFLPGAIDKVKGDNAAFASIVPPSSLKSKQQAFLGAMSKVTNNFIDSQKAAAAGNQAEFDRLESVNQDTDLPAMQKAVGELTTACGFPSQADGQSAP